MRKSLWAAALGLAMLAGGSLAPIATEAADLGVVPGRSAGGYCPQKWVCTIQGCGYARVCHTPCPSGRYTCAPLYGHYAPYGGVGYWGSYTYAGWGPSRW